MNGGKQLGDSWQQCLLPETSTIRQAIETLDRTGMQICLVVNPDGVLIGTLTDGDIRRGILRGVDLAGPVLDVVHTDALVVPPQWGRDIVLQLMSTNKIHQLPVVNAERKVVGLYVWDDLQKTDELPNVMVVMAGGKGTRLRPYTENCPKPLLPIGGKPMLEHAIERAKAEGFRHFVVAVHYLGHMIEDYFGDGSKWDVKIDYVREPAPLGTAGALGLLDFRPTAPIVVTNGDLVTDFRYAELLDFHAQHGAAATMAVRIYEWQNPFGVVQSRGVEITGFEEKPITRCYINAGIYVINPTALDMLGRNDACDMPEFFMRLQKKAEKTIVFPMHEPWMDVGRPADLEKARENRIAEEAPLNR